MEWLLVKILMYPRRGIAAVVAFLIVLSAFIWWQAVWQNPQHVFEDMLANNLATTSVTKDVKAGTSQAGVEQMVRLEMGSTNASEWLVAAKQTGASVTTDSIGSPNTGYIRYTQITAMGGKSINFKSIQNLWARSDGKTDTNLNGLFSQTLLDITSAPTPPIANLPVAQRENLLAFIRDEKVFTPDYAKIKHETVSGRSVNTYIVSVKLSAYVRLMLAFAHDLVLSNLNTVDPNQYASLAPIKFNMSVDQFSHQLVRVEYANSGFSQTYSDWGLQTPIVVPDHTVTTTELQHRLQVIGTSST